jgi:MFS family permease
METTTAKSKVTIWNKNFVAIFLVNAFLGFALSSTNTLVSTYAAFLGASAVLIGALTGMFYAVSFAVRPVSGPVTTKLDKKK